MNQTSLPSVPDAEPPRWIAWLPPALAATTMLLASLVLVGWAFDIAPLRGLLRGGRSGMNPTTATSFLLAAVAVLCLRRQDFSAATHTVGRALAAVVLLVGLLRLGAYAELWSFRPDVYLFASKLNGNQTAPNTALGFACLAAALLTLDVRLTRHRLGPAHPLLVATSAIAVLTLVGYLYEIAAFYGVRDWLPMSVNAALQFLLLATATLCSRPDREPMATILGPTFGGVVARRLLPAAFVIPITLGALLLPGWQLELYGQTFAMAVLVLSISVVFGGLIWWCARVIRITDAQRQRVNDELRLSEQRYHAVMRHSVEGIYLVDLDSARIVEANGAMESMLGYGPGELQDRSIVELVDDAAGHVLERLGRLRETHQALQGERRYRRRDGSVIDVYAGATVLSYGGREVACTVVHDVTERNRAHRLLQEKHDALERAVAAERAAMEQLRLAQSRLVQSEKLASLGQTVAGVAHEINNPLAFVSNNVVVLQRDVRGLLELVELYQRADGLIKANDAPLAAEIAEMSERIDLGYTVPNLAEVFTRSRDGLKRIQQIVKDLRDFARLDAADPHDVDLNEGIRSTLNIVQGRGKQRRVSVVSELGELPTINCQDAKVNQVVMNLVANAIDASPEGGQVTVRTARDGDGVKVEVIDSGTGVPAAIREKIFDPFFTTKPQGQGTGLGLSISYGIVRDHGGTIDVGDAPGGGAIFTVRLPAKR